MSGSLVPRRFKLGPLITNILGIEFNTFIEDTYIFLEYSRKINEYLTNEVSKNLSLIPQN